jgi:hypothetical protein
MCRARGFALNRVERIISTEITSVQANLVPRAAFPRIEGLLSLMQVCEMPILWCKLGMSSLATFGSLHLVNSNSISLKDALMMAPAGRRQSRYIIFVVESRNEIPSLESPNIP